MAQLLNPVVTNLTQVSDGSAEFASALVGYRLTGTWTGDGLPPEEIDFAHPKAPGIRHWVFESLDLPGCECSFASILEPARDNAEA